MSKRVIISISVRFASTEPTQKVEKHETASIQGVWGHRRPQFQLSLKHRLTIRS